MFNRCFDAAGNPAEKGDPGVQCFALNNFWRSVSNLTVNVNGTGQGRRYVTFYEDWSRDLVAELYRRDIEAFGYEFGAEPTVTSPGG